MLTKADAKSTTTFVQQFLLIAKCEHMTVTCLVTCLFSSMFLLWSSFIAAKNVCMSNKTKNIPRTRLPLDRQRVSAFENISEHHKEFTLCNMFTDLPTICSTLSVEVDRVVPNAYCSLAEGLAFHRSLVKFTRAPAGLSWFVKMET